MPRNSIYWQLIELAELIPADGIVISFSFPSGGGMFFLFFFLNFLKKKSEVRRALSFCCHPSEHRRWVSLELLLRTFLYFSSSLTWNQFLFFHTGFCLFLTWLVLCFTVVLHSSCYSFKPVIS